MKRDNCDFCFIDENRGTDLFKKTYAVDQQINIEGLDDEFVVMQDLVPLGIDGAHLLLLPKRSGRGHSISLASIDDQTRLKAASDTVINFLQKNFGRNNIFTFEHGPGFIEGEPIACGGCHMDHAHGHFVVLPHGASFDPIKNKLEESLSLSGWDHLLDQTYESEVLFSDVDKIAKLSPYLQIGIITNEDNRKSFTYVQRKTSDKVASQLMRKILALCVYGEKDSTYWHWRDITDGLTSNTRLEELQNIVMKFREIIQ